MKGSVDDYEVRPTSGGGWYMASPDVCIPNVIVTPVFDPKILREIDPEFRHDAPCPPEIYEIFIKAYSKPGDTILDGFVGAGTVGVALKMGRKVIGYDVDPLSIEFSQKRFEIFLNENQQDDENTLSAAA
jgi:DNA modification methylase